jgi:uncharacterized protein (TIRG00374 family)
MPWRYLPIPVVLAAVPWLTGALRLRLWLGFLGHRVPFRESLRVTLAGELAGAVTPTAVGGGLFKWGLLAQRGVRAGEAASIAALTSFEDVVFLALSIPAALALSHATRPVSMAPLGAALSAPRPGTIALIVAGLVLAGLAAWRFGRAERVMGRAARRVADALRRAFSDARRVLPDIARRGRARLLASFSLAGLQWVSRYSIPAVLLLALGVPVDPFLSFALAGLVFVVAAIVPTPGASGGAEAAFFLLFGPHVPKGTLGLLTAAWRFVTYYLQLAIGAVVFLALDRTQTRRAARSVPAEA